ncbi:MAG TPA: NCS2 family permease [Acholeplasmataceae bacterium]|jgi:AGZA family xanthine/uracil permease-like MFS transporter|nr:NCS2 family permease [Acholeplasmataceae bacterium]
MNDFFKLKENRTTVTKELVAGATTFFAMVYIIFVNPIILVQAGTEANPMPYGGIFLATIIAAVIGTLVMGLFANVPYAQAPGMGLNAFFTYTICGIMGFSWQEALGMVFICGLINVIITVTKIRKMIVKAIPESLQHAIGGGIGLFIAYIGLKNAGMLNFTADPGNWSLLDPTVPMEQSGIFVNSTIVPAITDFSSVVPVLAIIGLVITIVLLLLKVRGAILIGIILTTVIGIPLGVTDLAPLKSVFTGIGEPFKELGTTFGAAFKGIGTVFNDASRIPMVLLAIFALSLTDTFDTIGTFIGTGRRSGIFTDEDIAAIEDSKGFKTKMEKALFADSIATSVGAIFGTSNTTTYVESTAGIEAGGRTGLTSVFTAILFLLCVFLAPIAKIVPAAATAPALIVVGVLMAGSFKDINWNEFSEAVPAFFTALLMTLAYNISIGIAFGFIFYVIVKLCQKKVREIHPVLWGSTGLFLVYFILMALNGAGII